MVVSVLRFARRGREARAISPRVVEHAGQLGVGTSAARNAARRIRSDEIRRETQLGAGQAAADETAEVLDVFMACLLRIDGGAGRALPGREVWHGASAHVNIMGLNGGAHLPFRHTAAHGIRVKAPPYHRAAASRRNVP
jgi:hypothetical protein